MRKLILAALTLAFVATPVLADLADLTIGDGELDDQSPVGTAIVVDAFGNVWVVRYIESDHRPGLTSDQEILFRMPSENTFDGKR